MGSCSGPRWPGSEEKPLKIPGAVAVHSKGSVREPFPESPGLLKEPWWGEMGVCFQLEVNLDHGAVPYGLMAASLFPGTP